jgi:hypothetical protein
VVSYFIVILVDYLMLNAEPSESELAAGLQLLWNVTTDLSGLYTWAV